jgi:hypothetical protein
MRTLLFVVLAACASKPAPAPQNPPPAPPQDTGAAKDTRSDLEKRRDAACEVVGKRTAECAVKDSDALFAAGKIKKTEHDAATDPRVVAKDAEVYADKCKAKRDYSSRQIRVLEKCPEYEQECAPLFQCLQNLQPQAK